MHVNDVFRGLFIETYRIKLVGIKAHPCVLSFSPPPPAPALLISTLISFLNILFNDFNLLRLRAYYYFFFRSIQSRQNVPPRDVCKILDKRVTNRLRDFRSNPRAVL